MNTAIFYKSMIIVLSGLLLISFIGLAYNIVSDVKNDDKPDWADDMASKLNEKGGRIDIYTYSGSSQYPRTYNISKGSNIHADSQGLVLSGVNGLTIFRYSMISGIYINN